MGRFSTLRQYRNRKTADRQGDTGCLKVRTVRTVSSDGSDCESERLKPAVRTVRTERGVVYTLITRQLRLLSIYVVLQTLCHHQQKRNGIKPSQAPSHCSFRSQTRWSEKPTQRLLSVMLVRYGQLLAALGTA